MDDVLETTRKCPILPRSVVKASTAIRAGFRLSYDDVYGDVPSLMGLNFPPLLSTTLPRGSYTWATVLNQNTSLFAPDPTVSPQGTRGVLTFNALDTKPSVPYSLNYSLEVQRQLRRSLLFRVSYTGSQGRKLLVLLDPNQPIVTVNDPAKRGDQAPNQRTFPFPQYSNIFQAAFAGNSNFNGIDFVLSQRIASTLDFTASYEISKSLDDSSGLFPTDGATSLYADSKNRALDYGPSSFDIRRHLIVSFVYRLPSWRTRGTAERELLRKLSQDWTISGITTIRSGFPFPVRASSDVDFKGLNRWNPARGFTDRVDVRPGAMTTRKNTAYPDNAFDPGQFSFPMAGRPGDIRRNSLTGPPMAEQDFAVLRDLAVRNTMQAQLRVEYFNLFNHTNFKLPENRLDQSAAGKIGSAYDPRLIQSSARFRW